MEQIDGDQNSNAIIAEVDRSRRSTAPSPEPQPQAHSSTNSAKASGLWRIQ